MPTRPSIVTSFSLRPMIEHDIPACASVAHQAFLSDRHTQLKAANPTNPYDHEEGTKSQLRHLFSRQKGLVDLIVAEDDNTQKILGWIGWGYRGFDPVAREQEVVQSKQDPTRIISQPPQPQTKPDSSDPEDINLSDRDRLERYTSADMAAWMAYLMPPGTKCMYIVSIVVAPSSQGRGVGTALLRHGTTVADTEGVFCWVHASEAGAKVFVKADFREVGRLELDLDEWNSQGVAPSSGVTLLGSDGLNDDQGRAEEPKSDVKEAWGGYTFLYMRREPVRLDKQWSS